MNNTAGFFDRRRNTGDTGLAARPESGMAGSWHISLRFTLDTFRHGLDPLAIVQKLREIACNIAVAVVDDRLPALSSINPLSCHLGFEIQLSTEATRAELDSILEEARNDCVIRIFPPNRRSSDFIALIHSLPEEGRLGDILVECGAITRELLDQALEHQESASLTQALGEILIDQHKVAPGVVGAALVRQSFARDKRSADAHLAELLSITEELLARGQAASHEADELNHPALCKALRQMADLAHDLQASVQEFRDKKPVLTRQK